MRPIVFMFSGQGSQYYQMGRQFYDSHPAFRRSFDEGDLIVRDLLGRSIKDEIFSQPISREFNDFSISQPALVAIQYATARTLISEGIEPDWVWGYSAGELVAAIVSGVWNLETALRLTTAQTRLVMDTCPPGGMLAVLGSPALFDDLNDLRTNGSLAALNYANHFVVSGDESGLHRMETTLRNSHVVYQRLPVRFGFHSPAVDAAAAPFHTYCSPQFVLRQPSIPMLSSVTAAQVSTITTSHFWHAMRDMVRFSDALDAMGQHVTDGIFIDCGPSGTLATFLKYASAGRVLGLPLLSPYKREAINLHNIKEHVILARGRTASASGGGNRVQSVT